MLRSTLSEPEVAAEDEHEDEEEGDDEGGREHRDFSWKTSNERGGYHVTLQGENISVKELNFCEGSEQNGSSRQFEISIM